MSSELRCLVYGPLTLRLVGVTVGLHPHVHPVQGDIVVVGQTLHHIYRAGSDSRKEELPCPYFVSAGVVVVALCTASGTSF